MNFEHCARDVRENRLQTVITLTNVAVETSTFSTGTARRRRHAHFRKIVGAAAEEDATYAELKLLGDRVNAGHAFPIGIALTIFHVFRRPAGQPSTCRCEIAVGVGIHGGAVASAA